MGGALALDAAWLFAAFLVILIVAAAIIAARRFLLERGGGTVECGLRRGNGPWRLGVAIYQLEELRWFGILGLSIRPDEVFPRRDLSIVSRRLPSDAEAASLEPGMIVVECKLGEDSGQLGPQAPGGGARGSGAAPGPGGAPGSAPGGAAGAPGSGGAAGAPGASASAGAADGGIVELALGEAALTGLLSWLEAAPPGSHLDVAL
ncbi:MAG: DUF2550 domain-containing protein [Streptosporangiaceae bacterium]